MMDRAEKLIKGILNMGANTLRSLLLGGFTLSFTLATNACAQETPAPAAVTAPPQIVYKWAQHPSSSPSYETARAAMDKDNVFQHSQYKKGAGINPGINIGEYELNVDRIPETIAAPTEDEVDVGTICEKGFEFVCPHYIIDGQTSKLLGIIKANSVDVDPYAPPSNGYRVLKATFKREAANAKDKGDNLLIHRVDTYVFDKDKGRYEKTKTDYVPPAASPQ